MLAWHAGDPGFDPQNCIKPSVTVYSHNPSTRKVEAGRSGVLFRSSSADLRPAWDTRGTVSKATTTPNKQQTKTNTEQKVYLG